MSELAMKKMHLVIDEQLAKYKNPSDKEITQCIQEAFMQVENEWLQIARVSFLNGFPKAGYVGACALVAVVHNNKLYVANAGDSKAVLLRKKGDGYQRIKLSKTFNANKKYEQHRLKSKFENEKDIVICKRNDSKACYVKGNLMPSRALGDFRLKRPDFNFHNFPLDQGYRKPFAKDNYTGPYISSEPDVQVFDLEESDRFLVLASDGLWDEFNRKESAEIASKLEKDLGPNLTAPKLASELMEQGLNKAAEHSGISREQLDRIGTGRQRRKLVDDITIVVVDLQDQFKK